MTDFDEFGNFIETSDFDEFGNFIETSDFDEFGNFIGTRSKDPYIVEGTPQPTSKYDMNDYAFALCTCNESGFGYGIPIKRSKEWHYFKCLKCGTEGDIFA